MWVFQFCFPVNDLPQDSQSCSILFIAILICCEVIALDTPKLTEELKDIKFKVERAKNNREQLKKIYEDRIKSDPHKDKRNLSFEDLRREYVGSVEFVFLLSLFLFCLSVCLLDC